MVSLESNQIFGRYLKTLEKILKWLEEILKYTNSQNVIKIYNVLFVFFHFQRFVLSSTFMVSFSFLLFFIPISLLSVSIFLFPIFLFPISLSSLWALLGFTLVIVITSAVATDAVVTPVTVAIVQFCRKTSEEMPGCS